MFKKLLRSAASSEKGSTAAKTPSTVEDEAQDANPDSLSDGFALRRIQEDAKAKWTTPELVEDKDKSPAKVTRTRAHISNTNRRVPRTSSNTTKRLLRATVSLDTTAGGVDAAKESSARLRSCKTVDGGTVRNGSSHTRKSTGIESPEKTRRTRSQNNTAIDENLEKTRASRSSRTSPKRVGSDNSTRTRSGRSSRTPTRRPESDGRPKRSSSSTRLERPVRRTRSLERPNLEERSKRAARASAEDAVDRPMQRSSSPAHLQERSKRAFRSSANDALGRPMQRSNSAAYLPKALLTRNVSAWPKMEGLVKDKPEETYPKRPTSVRRIQSSGTHEGKATKKGMRRVKSGTHPRGMEAESNSVESTHSPRRKKSSRSGNIERSPSRRGKRSSSGKEREPSARREKATSVSGSLSTCPTSALVPDQNPMIAPQAA